jgi:integrase
LSPKKQEKALQVFAMEFEQSVKNGLVLDGRKTTLKNFVARWLSDYAELRLTPHSLMNYKAELDDKILPALGHLKLTDITVARVERFYSSLAKDGARLDGKPGGYSHGSIKKTAAVLSSVLHRAEQWGTIDRNPCDKAEILAQQSDSGIKFLTTAQTISLLEFIEQPYTHTIHGHKRTDDTGKEYTVGDYTETKTVPLQIRVLLNLAVYTGCRKGELLALQWPDIDFNNATVHITKSVSMVNGEAIIKPPKTKTSTRTISIPAVMLEKLKALKTEQAAYRLKVGSYWEDHDWLFTQDNGKLMSYSTPYQALQRIIKRYNEGKPAADQLPSIPFHGLRHTAATLLVSSGTNIKTISERLGHADTRMTLNTYTHALEECDRTAAAVLENMLVKHA